MSDFSAQDEKDGFKLKLWRGERMCLLGLDVAQPEDDLAGFAIEVQAPDSNEFKPLPNRLNFSYDKPTHEAVTGARLYSSLEAPFQRFRWIDFPAEQQPGEYRYRVTKMHMPQDGKLVAGSQLTLGLSLDPVTYADFLDVGFTRNFASSQAFSDRYGTKPQLIPAQADDGLAFHKTDADAYTWLGFEALELIKGVLDEAVANTDLSIELLAYDLNEPDLVARLADLGPRLRAVIDDSGSHAPAHSAESQAAARFAASAGAGNVRRTHFQGLQHHKVLIVKRKGTPEKVLFGSTNFSFRGLYIQANNVIVVQSPAAAALFANVFEQAFSNPAGFANNPLALQWHLVQAAPGQPSLQFCFSPHRDSGLSLNPLAAAIDQASSSVLYSIAFLNQIKTGPTREALDRLMDSPLFSYGVVNSDTGLIVNKPDHTQGVVDFAYLSAKAPEPFKSEWSGGAGIHIHHKFVVTDFNLPTARVFTGSSNLSPSGEEGNGDNLVMIQDQRIATSYAIEALRMFDHLHFRTAMQQALANNPQTAPKALTLRKPTAISGQPAWFADFYAADSQKAKDRQLFSS
ncbi:phospholipase D-like domain-containing protein [Andreprevotia lacus]|nr:phospholipase D-like domain-containing protein [Andreprevotia lacus]